LTSIADLECSNLVKKFANFSAVDDVSFQVAQGSFFSILGPSGCGKTTLMRMICGFENPTQGDIHIKGRSVIALPPNKRSVKMVFQHLALFPMMNVGENIAYGLRCRGENREDIRRKTLSVLERVGLPGIVDKQIAQLSGGQQQRVAIARCMVLEPDVLLLDEPLGALDLKLRERMKIELKLLQNQFNTTFLYITHDQSEALVMSDRVAVMDKGKFVQIGTPQQLYNQPETGFVAGFVGDNNRLFGRVLSVAHKVARIQLDNGDEILSTCGKQPVIEEIKEGKRVEIFIRPDALAMVEDGHDNRLTGTVSSLLFNGANSRILVRLKGDVEVEVSHPSLGDFAAMAPGSKIDLFSRPEHCLCFGIE